MESKVLYWCLHASLDSYRFTAHVLKEYQENEVIDEGDKDGGGQHLKLSSVNVVILRQEEHSHDASDLSQKVRSCIACKSIEHK